MTREVLDLVGAVLILLGTLFSVFAAVGVLRLPDLLSRMHAATKPQVLGLLLIAVGLTLTIGDVATGAVLLLVVLAQMLTAPVAAHMIGRASYRAGQLRRDLLVADELSDHVDPGEGDRGQP